MTSFWRPSLKNCFAPKSGQGSMRMYLCCLSPVCTCVCVLYWFFKNPHVRVILCVAPRLLLQCPCTSTYGLIEVNLWWLFASDLNFTDQKSSFSRTWEFGRSHTRWHTGWHFYFAAEKAWLCGGRCMVMYILVNYQFNKCSEWKFCLWIDGRFCDYWTIQIIIGLIFVRLLYILTRDGRP